jgi:hypothetical protein
MFLIGQQAGDEPLADNEYVRTGTILAVDNNRINFDEMWLDIRLQTQKGQTQTIVTDKTGASMSFSDLQAPCEVELTYREINNTFVVSKITVLAQYEYDDNGFIRSDQE